MAFNVPNTQVEWQTVAIALGKGLAARTRFRTYDPETLLKAENVEFPLLGGPQKRPGHLAVVTTTYETAITSSPIAATLYAEPFGDKVLPGNWLPGYGIETPLKVPYTPSTIGFMGSPMAVEAALGGASFSGRTILDVGAGLIPAGSAHVNTEPKHMPLLRLSKVAGNTGVYAGPGAVARHSDGRQVVANEDSIRWFSAGGDLLYQYTNVGGAFYAGPFSAIAIGVYLAVFMFGAGGFDMNIVWLSGDTVQVHTLAGYGADDPFDVCASGTTAYLAIYDSTAGYVVLRHITVGAVTATVTYTRTLTHGTGNPICVSVSKHPIRNVVAVGRKDVTGVGTASPYYAYAPPNSGQYLIIYDVPGQALATETFDLIDGVTATFAYKRVVSGPNYDIDYDPSTDVFIAGACTDWRISLAWERLPVADLGSGLKTYNLSVFTSVRAKFALGFGTGTVSDPLEPVSTYTAPFWDQPLVFRDESLCKSFTAVTTLADGDNSAASPVAITEIATNLGLEVNGQAYLVGDDVHCPLIYKHQTRPNVVYVPDFELSSCLICDVKLRPYARIGLYTAIPDVTTHNTSFAVSSPGVVTGSAVALEKPNNAPRSNVTTTLTLEVSLDYAASKVAVETQSGSYFSAGLLWHYDGDEVTEAGFVDAPEIISVNAYKPVYNAGGALVSFIGRPWLDGWAFPSLSPPTSGTLSLVHDDSVSVISSRTPENPSPVDATDPIFFRAVLSYTTSAGAYAESASLPYVMGGFSNAATNENSQVEDALPAQFWSSGVEFHFNIKIPPTHHNEMQLAIYATNTNGSAYHLLQSYKVTPQDSQRFDWVQGSSAFGRKFVASYQRGDSGFWEKTLSKQPTTPQGNAGYLMPYTPPSTEIIAQGRDRLWMAGGALGNGNFTCSRLASRNEIVTWNPYLDQVADISGTPIRDIVVNGATVLLLTDTNLMAVYGDGPDNASQGELFTIPREISRTGFPVGRSGVLTKNGLFVLTKAGVKVYNERDGLNEIPALDTFFESAGWLYRETPATIRAVVYDQKREQVRWYMSDDRVLVLDVVAQRASIWTGIPAVDVVGNDVIRADGKVWTMTDGVWTDAGNPYTMAIRTAWLSPGGKLGDFARIRRAAFYGEYLGAHDLRVSIYYNGAADPQEVRTLTPATQLPDTTMNTSAWFVPLRVARQKHNIISFELDDMGATTGAFIPTVVAYELGYKHTLQRTNTTTATPESGGET